MPPLLAQLSMRLRHVRETRQLAVSEVSKLASVTTQYVHALERAEYNPGLEVLSALARAEQVAVADFFAFPSPPKLRHRARDLIFRASDDLLPELVAGMEAVLGVRWEQIFVDLSFEEGEVCAPGVATVGPPPILPLLATRLKQMRRMRGMRMVDVAALIGLTSQSAYAIERGAYNPRLEVLQALARIYQVDVADLFAFPTEADLRHRARDLIVRTPSAALAELVVEMERRVGLTWADLQRSSGPESRKRRAMSR